MIVCDATIVNLTDGRVRMYYKGANGPGGPGQATHKIFSAVSRDGLSFQREGVRVDSEATDDRGWASVPEAIRLKDGRVRIYYVSGNPAARGGIMSALSPDGLAFTQEEGARVHGLVDPAVIQLPQGTFLMFVASIEPRLPPYLARGIYMLSSEDGLSFENRTTVLEEPDVFDPTVLQIDEKTLRVYFGYVRPPNAPETRSMTVRLDF